LAINGMDKIVRVLLPGNRSMIRALPDAEQRGKAKTQNKVVTLVVIFEKVSIQVMREDMERSEGVELVAISRI